jgi:hypothetical protein
MWVVIGFCYKWKIGEIFVCQKVQVKKIMSCSALVEGHYTMSTKGGAQGPM